MALGLQSLIRINEWEVDQRRRKLGSLLGTLHALESSLVGLAEELQREQGIAGSSPEEAGFLYGNYATAVIERRHQIEDAMVQIEEQIAEAREELNEAYRDLKKYEVAQETRDLREAEELARREQADFDELALQGYQRKH